MQDFRRGHLQFRPYRRGLPSCSLVSLEKIPQRSALKGTPHPAKVALGIFPANSRARKAFEEQFGS